MTVTSRLCGTCCLVLMHSLPLWAERDRLVIDDFEGALTWEVTRNISGEGDCEFSLTREAKTGQGAMLVTDRCAERHAQWLLKRCPNGVWDLSTWQRLHLWVRGDASRKALYFKAVDEAGKQMFWRIGRLHRRDWRPFSVDLTRDDSVFRHENPNLARITAVGLRLDRHCGYEIALDDVWLTDRVAMPVSEWPRANVGELIGHLEARHVNDIEDSIVGVNLHPRVGRLTEEDIGRLAAAGVKWAARMPLSLEAAYDRRIRRALLRHRFELHGLFGVNSLLEGQVLEDRLGLVRRTVAGLRHITRHWEIGNEPNIPKFWSGKPNATEFGLMVKAFAQAIRQELPDAIIISGGLVGYPLDFAKEMLDTGMGDWVSYIGIHTPRSCPEDGGRGRTHAEAIAAFRSLIRSYNPQLEVWQSEVQATPNVNFADVKGGITDYQQARHVARRFFVEQWLGYPASFWQLFKAGPALDHPGALLRVDGTPTMKFFAIQNVAAILDKRVSPIKVDVSLETPAAPRLIWQGGAAPVRVPSGVNVDLLARVTTKSRTIDVQLCWLDSKGREVESVSDASPIRGGPGTIAVCRRYPHAFRPAEAVAARVEIRDSSPQSPVVEDARLIAHSRGSKLCAHAFRRKGDGALFVAYWLTPRPPTQTVRGVCTLTVGRAAESLRDPVAIDMINGSAHRVRRPSREAEALVLHNLPVADYAMVLADLGSIRTQPQSALLSHFSDADDLTAQFIGDRFGRGRPQFWRLVREALSRHGTDRPMLSQAFRRAHERFAQQLTPVGRKVDVRDLPTRVSRIHSPSWRRSIVNPKSRQVDRYFADVHAPGVNPSRLSVTVAGKPWPRRQWQDVADRSGSWFATKTGSVWRVFVVVPNRHEAPSDATIEYVHDACTVNVFCFHDRATERPTLVYWAEPYGEAAMPAGAVTLAGSPELIPACGVVRGVAVKARDEAGERILRGVPLARSPTVLREP